MCWMIPVLTLSWVCPWLPEFTPPKKTLPQSSWLNWLNIPMVAILKFNMQRVWCARPGATGFDGILSRKFLKFQVLRKGIFAILRQSQLKHPPRHTLGIWRLFLPMEEGGNLITGLDFMLRVTLIPRGQLIMVETNFNEFKGKSCVFVADWLETKGLHKLCSVFEGVYEQFISLIYKYVW